MEPHTRELREALGLGLGALGFAESDLERWVLLAQLLDRWSQRINLTGHRGVLEIANRLLLEAAALSRVLPAARSIADLGSGAGIPGLPLALCRPQSQVWLVESRERRHHFQRAAIRALRLTNAAALRGRVEDLAPRPSDGVVAQALSQPNRALHWMRPWMSESGWVALATVPTATALSHPDLVATEMIPYAAPGGPPRAVWLARLRAA